MTDDLFDDFDLKPVSQAEKNNTENAVQENLTDKKITVETENPSEFSSEDLHPDIFAENKVKNDGEMTDDEIRNLQEKIEAEKSVLPVTFAFDNQEKEPFETVQAVPSDSMPETTVVEVRRIDRIRRPDVAIDPENYGATLRKLRETACISLGELSEELRIKENFLAALEREDYENLPPEVFIIAYIRRLGGIYHLTEEEINAMTAKVRERMEIDLPDDMEKVVIFNETSEENEHKLHYILTLFAIIVTVVILAIAAGVYFFAKGYKNDSTASTTPVMPRKSKVENFSSETLIKLQPAVKLDAPPLKITK